MGVAQSPEMRGSPSPPLSTTIQSLVTALTDRKDRERSRAHELEVLRLKREEADRIRWHQREMMRLQIQLIRAERGLTSTTEANPSLSASRVGSTHQGLSGRRDSTVSHFGVSGVEDDLAMAAGLGDDGMSLEGDGEGEPEDEMMDPEPPRSRHMHNHSGSMQGGPPQ